MHALTHSGAVLCRTRAARLIVPFHAHPSIDFLIIHPLPSDTPLRLLQLALSSVLVDSAPLSWTQGEISSELYRDWLWDGNFKFCLIFTHFSRFSPFSGYIWWNNTLSSLENFSLNSILVFVFLMSHHDNGGFLKIAQKRDSISKKTSFCIMVINTDHQESWFLSVGHPLCALR